MPTIAYSRTLHNIKVVFCPWISPYFQGLLLGENSKNVAIYISITQRKNTKLLWMLLVITRNYYWMVTLLSNAFTYSAGCSIIGYFCEIRRNVLPMRFSKMSISDSGVNNLAVASGPRSISSVKVKDTHLMNIKLPPAEILCGEWPTRCRLHLAVKFTNGQPSQ